MPASANWPDSTLISPTLTVPCALADAVAMSSASAEPSARTVRFITFLPEVCFGVVEENCTHERLHGRIVRGEAARGAVGHRPTRDHRTGIDVSARRRRATTPDDVVTQRAIGRPIGPARRCLQRRWRRYRSAPRRQRDAADLSTPPHPCGPVVKTFATIWG